MSRRQNVTTLPFEQHALAHRYAESGLRPMAVTPCRRRRLPECRHCGRTVVSGSISAIPPRSIQAALSGSVRDRRRRGFSTRMRGLIPGLRRRPGVAGISPTLWFCGGWMAAEWHRFGRGDSFAQKGVKSPGNLRQKRHTLPTTTRHRHLRSGIIAGFDDKIGLMESSRLGYRIPIERSGF